MNAADHDRLLGVTLEGRYHLLKLLGKGGMGRVYLAEERLLRRLCAVKVLLRDHAENERNVERFLREAQVIARVRHENIVEIYSFGQDPDGEVFYVMELLAGEDLEARLRDLERGPPDWRELCRWSVQACRALAAVHDAGIVHRDLKPGNLFLTRRSDGSPLVKLLDFGIARPTESMLTGTGAFLGTVPYMSPEQVQLQPLDGRSDIYALGVLLYRAIAGRPPFRGDPVRVLQDHVHAPPPPLLPLAQFPVPAALVGLIDRCLHKSREQRFQSMREVEVDLVALLAGPDPELAGPASPSLLAVSPVSIPPPPLVDSAAPTPSPPEPSEASTSVYVAPRPPAEAHHGAATHAPAPSTDKHLNLQTLAPDDSLVVPHQRFRAATPTILPIAVPQAEPAPLIEAALREAGGRVHSPASADPLSLEPQVASQQCVTPTPEDKEAYVVSASPPTPGPQPPALREIDRSRAVLGLAAASILALLLAQPQPSREPTFTSTRMARPWAASLAVGQSEWASPAALTSAADSQWPGGEATDEVPPDETAGEANSGEKTGDASPDETAGAADSDETPDETQPDEAADEANSKRTNSGEKTGKAPPKPEQTLTKPKRWPRPGLPLALERRAKACRVEHDAVALPAIVMKYAVMDDGKVAGPRTISAVPPALAACLERALLSTTFARDDFGVGKSISL